MNASIPRRLAESREFRGLGTLARVVLRILWRRGEERRWSREELLAELQTRGLFLGRVGLGEFETIVAELSSAGALEPDPDAGADGALLLPVLSADTPRDARSESPAARRKREQRERDRKDPDRVAARQATRQAHPPDAQSAPPSTAPERPPVEPPSARDTARDNSRDSSPLSHPDVTVTGHVTNSVTVTSGGVGGGRGISSSSSSSSSEETRHSEGIGARPRGRGPEGAPVTPVTGGVTPPVTGGVTPDVTPPGPVAEEAQDAPITGPDIVRAFGAHALDRAEDLCRAQGLGAVRVAVAPEVQPPFGGADAVGDVRARLRAEGQLELDVAPHCAPPCAAVHSPHTSPSQPSSVSTLASPARALSAASPTHVRCSPHGHSTHATQTGTEILPPKRWTSTVLCTTPRLTGRTPSTTRAPCA